ncbi:unnamed protein product [Acanthosepion pharaonis]|uniref:Uncharacterized protein n=1 Tax=Acanthosepion pharaonis TaxID=158019 RepID=A0A812CX86_ACAPH|nr:unnamed protein product [Sepia pharaonis]
MASTSQCTDFATASNIDYFEKACGTREDEERGESVGLITAGDTELTAVKGSLDLTATVDVDPAQMVDGADLTANVHAVDSIPTMKINVDTSEGVVVETETLDDPMEDELPHEVMAKNDFFKAEFSNPLSFLLILPPLFKISLCIFIYVFLLSIYLSIYLSSLIIYQSIYSVCSYLSIYCIHLFIYLSIYLSIFHEVIYLSMSVYYGESIYLFCISLNSS